MIIGYDFWCDSVYYDSAVTDIVVEDNDGIAFDTRNPIYNVNDFTLKSGEFDELHITKDSLEIDNSIEKTSWTLNTVLLAKFKNNLMAGTIGINGYDMSKIEVKKRRQGESLWQTYFTIDYDKNVNMYTIIDKFIENEEGYEYCLRPVALNDDGVEIYGNDTLPQGIYISYDHSHLFDNTASYDLLYNFKINDMTNQLGVNVIDTLGSQYPYVVYGQNNYLKGSMECLLVSDESVTGAVNIRSEKKLRNNILSFLTNKNYKVLKCEDGSYMLIQIVGTPTLTPSNDIMGIYQISFEYVQVGNVNNVAELTDANLTFDYFTTNNNTNETQMITQVIG